MMIVWDVEIEVNVMEVLEDEDVVMMWWLCLEGVLFAATKSALRLESFLREDVF